MGTTLGTIGVDAAARSKVDEGYSELDMTGGTLFQNLNWFHGAITAYGSGDMEMMAPTGTAKQSYPIIASNRSRDKGAGVYVKSDNVHLRDG